MPGQTDNYGIRYPCPGDPIDPTDFANWAIDIENAVEQVETAALAATSRPRVQLRTPVTGTACAAGVATAMSFDTIVFNEGMTVAPLAAPHTTIFPGDGVSIYVMTLTATFIPVNTATTVTSFQGFITANNDVCGRTMASSTVPTIAKPLTLVMTGFVDSVFGATASFQWTGTGGPLNVYCQFSASFVAQL